MCVVGRSARSNAWHPLPIGYRARLQSRNEAGAPKSVVSLAGPDLALSPQWPRPRIFAMWTSSWSLKMLGAMFSPWAAMCWSRSRPQHCRTSRARRGCRVRMVAVEEFHKADGALTCLSIRILSQWLGHLSDRTAPNLPPPARRASSPPTNRTFRLTSLPSTDQPYTPCSASRHLL